MERYDALRAVTSLSFLKQCAGSSRSRIRSTRPRRGLSPARSLCSRCSRSHSSRGGCCRCSPTAMVRLPLEAVPNFSEGRDAAVIEAIGGALSEHAELLDVHADADHNRSVFTLVGESGELVEALLAGIACARERIDLRRHEGAHPRIGAADVVPVVPVRPEDAERARAAASELARRAGELGLPVS